MFVFFSFQSDAWSLEWTAHPFFWVFSSLCAATPRRRLWCFGRMNRRRSPGFWAGKVGILVKFHGSLLVLRNFVLSWWVWVLGFWCFVVVFVGLALWVMLFWSFKGTLFGVIDWYVDHWSGFDCWCYMGFHGYCESWMGICNTIETFRPRIFGKEKAGQIKKKVVWKKTILRHPSPIEQLDAFGISLGNETIMESPTIICSHFAGLYEKILESSRILYLCFAIWETDCEWGLKTRIL